MSGEWIRTGKVAVMACLGAGLITNILSRETEEVH
jgi:hypothetical protein